MPTYRVCLETARLSARAVSREALIGHLDQQEVQVIGACGGQASVERVQQRTAEASATE